MPKEFSLHFGVCGGLFFALSLSGVLGLGALLQEAGQCILLDGVRTGCYGLLTSYHV